MTAFILGSALDTVAGAGCAVTLALIAFLNGMGLVSQGDPEC
jgi:hypothetical protein